MKIHWVSVNIAALENSVVIDRDSVNFYWILDAHWFKFRVNEGVDIV